jgi:hypothetical protein
MSESKQTFIDLNTLFLQSHVAGLFLVKRRVESGECLVLHLCGLIMP